MSTATKPTQRSVGKKASRSGVDPTPALSVQVGLNGPNTLKEGNLHLSHDKKGLTLLLIGEAGVGKTALASLIFNILGGRLQSGKRWLDIRKQKDEVTGTTNYVPTSSSYNTPTHSSRLYVFKSKNGTNVRILDTPGLSNIPGSPQDTLNRKNIKKHIRGQIEAVNAVLILVDASNPRFEAAADFVVNTLTPLFSHSIMGNIGILFTNTTNQHAHSLEQVNIPDTFQDAPRFFLDNPIVMHNNYHETKAEGNQPYEVLTTLAQGFQDGANRALNALTGLFGWLDGLASLPQKSSIHFSTSNMTIDADPTMTNLDVAMGNQERQPSNGSVSKTPPTTTPSEPSMPLTAVTDPRPSHSLNSLNRTSPASTNENRTITQTSPSTSPGTSYSPSALESPKNLSPLEDSILRLASNRRELTILLFGGANAGKTSFLSLVTNTLTGKPSGQYLMLHDRQNEGNTSSGYSHTKSAKLYEFKVRERLTLRVLDTPGLADIRGLEQDALHKNGTIEIIRQQIRIVDAILVFIDGSTPLNAANAYALSVLSSMIPRSLASNIGVVFTRASSSNSRAIALPGNLRDVKVFHIDNPVALQGTSAHSRMQGTPGNPNDIDASRGDNTTQILTQLFHWLDGLSSQPTQGFSDLFEKSREIDERLISAIKLIYAVEKKRQQLQMAAKEIQKANAEVSKRESLISSTTSRVREQMRTTWYNKICGREGCGKNCRVSKSGMRSTIVKHSLFSFWKGGDKECSICGHERRVHHRVKALWVDARQPVDAQEARDQFEQAREIKHRWEMQWDATQREVNTMDQDLYGGLAKLGQLVESYAYLSHSGDYAYHLQESMKLAQFQLDLMRHSKRRDHPGVERLERNLREMRLKMRVLMGVQTGSEQRVNNTRDTARFSSYVTQGS